RREPGWTRWVLQLVLLPFLEELRGGNDPGCLAGQVDSRGLSVAELLGEVLQDVLAVRSPVLPVGPEPDGPEVDVAGLLQGTVGVEPTLVIAVPVVFDLLGTVGEVEGDLTVAVDGPVVGVDSLLTLGERKLELLGGRIGDGFEGGGRRVETADGQVVERPALSQLVECLLIQTGHELLGIEGGVGGQGEYLAGLGVEDDGCGSLGLREDIFTLGEGIRLHLVGQVDAFHQRPAHHLLQLEIDGEIESVPDLRSRLGFRLYDLATRHPELGYARFTPELVVIDGLYSELTDADRRIQVWIALQVAAGRETEMAGDV